jgi:hypothetical protein
MPKEVAVDASEVKRTPSPDRWAYQLLKLKGPGGSG